MAPIATLVVEDEPEIARLISQALAPHGFAVTAVGTGREALACCQEEPPDLAIIDLGLPDGDGLDLLRRLQQTCPCAVIILTGRADVADRVLGLELGADDYLVKPFDPRELAARARTVMRRYQASEVATERRSGEKGGNWAEPHSKTEWSIARFGPWAFDPGTFSLRHDDGAEQILTAAEAELLLAFLRHPNRILSREALAGGVRLEAFDRSIDVRVSRLRKKLRDHPNTPKIIKTVYGAGYLFALPVTWEAGPISL